MSRYSETSEKHLAECDERLQRVFRRVVEYHDNTVLEGHRSVERQAQLYAEQKTEVLHSKHNTRPSRAIDAGPYIPGRGIPWPNPEGPQKAYVKDMAQFYYFAGIVMATAREMGIPIRWGGDWDRDHDLIDQTFDDLVHFEIHGG